MDEKTKTIIDRARALLVSMAGVKMAAQQGCGPLTHGIAVDILGARLFMEADDRIAAGTLQAIAAAPGMLTSLCDAMESAERRAEEAEAQAAAMRFVLARVRVLPGVRSECESALDANAGRALLDRLHSAEAERDSLKSRFTRLNPATGKVEPWDPTETLREIRECVPDDRRLDGFTLTGAVSEMARLLAAAEAKVARLEARKAAACGHCGGFGVTYDPDEVDIPEGPLPPEMVCPDCHGSGAVIVEGGE